MLRTIMIRTAILAFAWSLSVAAHAYASDLKPIDVPAGDLSAALQAFAKQSGVELVYESKLLEGLRTKGVKGNLSTEDAVTKLLEGTSLTLRKDPSGALLVAPPKSNLTTFQGSANDRPLSSREEREGPAEREGEVSGARDSGKVRTAQAEGEKEELSTYEGQELPAPGETGKAIPEVLIRGSKSLNADIERSRDDIQPYIVFDRNLIESSGAANVEDFMRQRLPMNSASSANSQASPELSNNSQINLRGLGTKQTLILIDGHRVASTGISGSTNQPNLNGIPISAIERIEILPTTASGIYGGGATGGVVNVVLRRDYSGVEGRMSYGNAFSADATTREVSLHGGFSFFEGRTTLMVVGSYADSDQLRVQDRDLLQRGRAEILANNPSFFASATNPPLGATPNLRSSTGANLVLRDGTSLNSPITFVPEGYAGAGSDGGAALVANAGQYNLELANSTQLGGGRAGFLGSPTSKSLLTTLRQDFTPWLQGFVEGSASDTANYLARTSANLTSSFSLPASAPTNPFRQDVRVTLATAGDNTIVGETTDRRIMGGLILRLPLQWSAEADYTWQRSRSNATLSPTFSPTVATAVANGSLNVLRDTNTYPLDFGPYVQAANRVGAQESTLKDTALRVGGPWGSLPAGPIAFSASISHREEDFSDSYQFVNPTITIYTPDRSQTIDSVYLESRVPLFSHANAISGLQELELQLAGRWDEYTVNGATTSVVNPTPATQIVRSTNKNSSIDPTVGLRWRPFADVTFRGSYGTGFLPPSVTQLTPNSPSTGSNVIDPRRGNAPSPAFQVLTGGNPNLSPEESESWSVGAIFTPRLLDGLRLSVDYTRIRKSDNIASLSLQQVVDNENILPTRVTRGANLPGDPPGWAGPILAIDRTTVNVDRTLVAAYDMQLDYRVQTAAWGAFDFFGSATRATTFETQLVPTTQAVENVGVVSFLDTFPLKWKFNAGLSWTLRNWDLTWVMSYSDSYRLINATQVLNQGDGGRVPSQVYHDVSGNYRFERSGSNLVGPLKDVELRFGVRNIFDKRPPFDASNATNIYSAFGDPRGANYYLSLIVQF